MSIRKTGIIFIVLLALSARLIPGPRTIDDAYITFRYARNILDGQGFVYNLGERVLGTTTPLYTFLMTGLGAVSGGSRAPFPWLALGINAIADAITCVLVWKIGQKAKHEWVGVVTALIWAVAPYSVTFAIGGMETSVYILLLTATILAYLHQKHIPSFLFASLAFLTRPDALILIIPLLLDRLVRSFRGEKIRVEEGLIFAIPIAIWYGFAWIYFGSPIPHSVTAKVIAYHLHPGESFIRMVQHYATPFLEDQILGTPIAVSMGVILYPFLFMVGALRALRDEPRLLVFILFPWIYFLAFSLPNTLIFRWYLTPPLPAYFFFIIFGAWHILNQLLKKIQKHASLRLVPWGVILLVPLVFTMNGWILHPDHGNDLPCPKMAWIKLELLYQQAASLIRPEVSASDLLAAGDVGVLGYSLPVRILDTVGLNSSQPLRYYPLPEDQYVINYAIATDLIIDEKPGWLIVLEIYGRNTFLKDARFQKQYNLRYTLPTDIYDSRGMLIFQRK